MVSGSRPAKRKGIKMSIVRGSNIRTPQEEIEFPPHLCNKVCPEKTEKKKTEVSYQLSPQSYVSFLKGTKLWVYVNQDPSDPSSDVSVVEVVISNPQHVSAVLVDSMLVKEV